MPAALAVSLLGLLAQLPKLLRIVEDVGKTLLFPIVRPLGALSGLAGLIEDMSEAPTRV